MSKSLRYKELRVFAEEIRVKTLTEFGYIGFGHVGGAMSIVELIALLYGEFMRYDPSNPKCLTGIAGYFKGHSGPLCSHPCMKGSSRPCSGA